MNPITGTSKRGGEPLEQPFLKKFKKENVSSLESPLARESLCLIASHLSSSFKGLLIFEQLFRGAVEYTSPVWEERIKREEIDFSWSLPDNELYSGRARWIHLKALTYYVEARQKQTGVGGLPTFESVNRLFLRFQGIMERYPSSLGAFLWKDLNCLKRIDSPAHDRLFQRDFSIAGTTGDFLLQGLSYLSEYPIQVSQQQNLRRLASKSLKKAILQGATSASSLAIRMLSSKYFGHEWYYELVCASLSKGDHEGMSLFLRTFPSIALSLHEMGITHPFILAEIALQKSLQEAEALMDEAIKDWKDLPHKFPYDNDIPPLLHFKAAEVKFSFGKWKEAEDHYDKLIALNGYRVPGDVYENIVMTKMMLNKFKEAKDFSNQVVNFYGKNVPPKIQELEAKIEVRIEARRGMEEVIERNLGKEGICPPFPLNRESLEILFNNAIIHPCLRKIGETTYLVEFEEKTRKWEVLYLEDVFAHGGRGEVRKAINCFDSTMEVLKQAIAYKGEEANRTIRNEYDILTFIHSNGRCWGVEAPPRKLVQLAKQGYPEQYGYLGAYYLGHYGQFNDHISFVQVHQLLSGLMILDKKNILHGDLKPENILFKNGGDIIYYHLHLADMGEAVRVTPEIKIDELASYGGHRGHSKKYSPLCDLHLSREFYKQGKRQELIEIEKKRDVFAMGVILYERLQRHAPYALDQEGCPQVNDALKPITRLPIPQELETLIQEMLHPHYKKRPSGSVAWERFNAIFLRELPFLYKHVQDEIQREYPGSL